MAFGDKTRDPIIEKLDPFLNNVPDYDEVKALYKKQGRLKSSIRLLQREIQRTEEEVNRQYDKPRSNDTRRVKDNATSHLNDKLAELEAELAIIDSDVKAMEYFKSMFQAAVFRAKMIDQI
jgi:predicted  nucleic acid-binding Zn-ribbon protein